MSKQMIFITKGTPAEVMADINEAVEYERIANEDLVEEKYFMDFTGATPDIER